MSTRTVHVLVFDGFADWEPALALAELRRSGELGVTSVGFTGQPVTSMGGLRILPDRALALLEPKDVRLFLVPGGDMWEGAYPRAELEAALRALVAAKVPIAAICGATLALARAGLLAGRAHTSNGLDYLTRMVPEYAGADGYVEELAVRDGGLITASGVGHTEFAREILDELDVLVPADRPVWYHVFKYGHFPQSAT
jgi:putative intracellular protease/amidase